MNTKVYWPQYLTKNLVRPRTTLYFNLETSAARYADRTAIGFFGRDISYRELKESSDRFAGWLLNIAKVTAGERIAIYMQNTPQWLMAYYGTMRANAVVVPVNPMNREDELKKILVDSGASVVVCSQELAEQALAVRSKTGVRQIVVASYSDYLPSPCDFTLPEWMTSPARPIAGCTLWSDSLVATASPQEMTMGPDDLVSINYTSGSSGIPKGCMHTHQTFMHTMVGLATWHGHPPGTVFLGVAPMYQVAGLVHTVLCGVYVGGTVVPLPRWDRHLAARLIERYSVHFAGLAPTAVNDLISDPALEGFNLSSLKRVSFGGATMPEAVFKKVQDRLGLTFIEAYGLTETATTTHANPIDRPKRQCLGVPFFNTDALVIDPQTLAACGVGEPGEIVVRGPQLFKGYWQQPEATAAAFVEIDGKSYFRTGDIGRVDEEGYFFMTDRLKRMINASGFKVWPAEVESILYSHPAINEVCVIGVRDPYRGETVKAVISLRPDSHDNISEDEIIAWSKERMAAYKYPRIVQFVDALPKSPVGKIMWKELQDAESRQENQ